MKKLTSSNNVFILIIGVAIGSAINTIFCTLISFETTAGFSNKNDADSSTMMMIPHPKSYRGKNNAAKKPVVVVDDMTSSSSSSSSFTIQEKNSHKQYTNHSTTSTPINDVNHYKNYYPNIMPRAYPSWPNDTPLPCFDRPWSFEEEVSIWKTRKQGFLFLKPIKVGSSTAMGVNLRIAEKEAVRQKNHKNISMSTFHKKNFTRCTATHTHCNGMEFASRIKSQSFAWSMLRDPTKRVISEFFHFLVSREKLEPTTSHLISSIRTGQVKSGDYYIKQHSMNLVSIKRRRKPMEDYIMNILNDYDFIGITERFDESLVALQQLLRLPLSDILYLNAKRAGNYDDGGLRATCFYIVPSFLTPGMKEYFQSDEWQNTIKNDMILYTAANASLTKTIEETIGRTKFDLAYKKFRYAQKLINDACSTDLETKFPCTSDGVFVQETQTDCYHKDSGCGKSCIDRIVQQHKHDDIFT